MVSIDIFVIVYEDLRQNDRKSRQQSILMVLNALQKSIKVYLMYLLDLTGTVTLRTTVCPRSCDPFYIVTYHIKWVTTSWTDGIFDTAESLLRWVKMLGDTAIFWQKLPQTSVGLWKWFGGPYWPQTKKTCVYRRNDFF